MRLEEHIITPENVEAEPTMRYSQPRKGTKYNGQFG